MLYLHDFLYFHRADIYGCVYWVDVCHIINCLIMKMKKKNLLSLSSVNINIQFLSSFMTNLAVAECLLFDALSITVPSHHLIFLSTNVISLIILKSCSTLSKYIYSQRNWKSLFLWAFKLHPNKSPFQHAPMRDRFTFLNHSSKCHLLKEKL